MINWAPKTHRLKNTKILIIIKQKLEENQEWVEHRTSFPNGLWEENGPCSPCLKTQHLEVEMRDSQVPSLPDYIRPYLGRGEERKDEQKEKKGTEGREINFIWWEKFKVKL